MAPGTGLETSAGVEVDWRLVLRAAVVGLMIIVPDTILRVVLDREVRDFDHSGWIYPLSIIILFGYFFAGWVAGRNRPDTPLIHGTVAGAGVLVLWIPIRIVIWAAREQDRGLFSGSNPALRPGQLVGDLVIAAGIGMLGAAVGVWMIRRGARGSSAPESP
jgi:hypothetical protein